MKLFSIDSKGELNPLNKAEFLKNEIYLVDDKNTIYIWIGNDMSLTLKDLSVKVAREYNKRHGSGAKLLLLDQGSEYGSFLFLIDILKKGVPTDEQMERRPELKLKQPKILVKAESQEAVDQIEDVVMWLDQLGSYRDAPIKEKTSEADAEPKETEIKEGGVVDLKAEINLNAFFLSKESYDYNTLCWLLAEIQLQIQMSPDSPTDDQIRDKADQVYNSSCTFDELCWLISELKVYDEQHFFEMF